MTGRLSIRMQIAALALCGLMVPAHAADQDNIKELFGVAQERNARQLRTYEWNCRTELLIDEKTAGVRTDKVQYDYAGRLHRTTIEAKTEPADQRKRDESKALLQRLSRFAQTYANLSDSQRAAAIRSVRVKSGEAELAGTVQLTAQNVVVPGDLIAIWADASTLLFKRVQIYSTFENHPIQMSAHYEQLVGGPVVPARMQVSYPAKKMEAQVTNAAFKAAGPPTVATATAPVGSPGLTDPAEESADVDPGWPRRLKNEGGALLTFQPQVDEWKDFKEITWRMALAITPAGTKEVVGAATMRGLTDVDNEQRIVTLHDITVVRANFPSLDAAEGVKMEQLVGKF